MKKNEFLPCFMSLKRGDKITSQNTNKRTKNPVFILRLEQTEITVFKNLPIFILEI